MSLIERAPDASGEWSQLFPFRIPVEPGKLSVEHRVAVMAFLGAICREVSTDTFETGFDEVGNFRQRFSYSNAVKIPLPAHAFGKIRKVLLQLELDPPPPAFEITKPPSSGLRESVERRTNNVLERITALFDKLSGISRPTAEPSETTSMGIKNAFEVDRPQFAKLSDWVDSQLAAGQLIRAIELWCQREAGKADTPRAELLNLELGGEARFVIGSYEIECKHDVESASLNLIIRSDVTHLSLGCRMPHSGIDTDMFDKPLRIRVNPPGFSIERSNGHWVLAINLAAASRNASK